MAVLELVGLAILALLVLSGVFWVILAVSPLSQVLSDRSQRGFRVPPLLCGFVGQLPGVRADSPSGRALLPRVRDEPAAEVEGFRLSLSATEGGEAHGR